jgi:hypothetical protein
VREQLSIALRLSVIFIAGNQPKPTDTDSKQRERVAGALDLGLGFDGAGSACLGASDTEFPRGRQERIILLALQH